MFSTEARAIFSKAAETPSLFFALVYRCCIFGCFAKNSFTASSSTSLSSIRSILFPTKIKGNFSGYFGAPWFRNSWIHDSMLSNDWFRGWRYLFVGDVIYQNAAVCASVERSSQTSELLLSGCVPDLICEIIYFKVDDFAIHNDLLFHEICSYSGLVRLKKLLINVSGVKI